jgi:hypothetical protein
VDEGVELRAARRRAGGCAQDADGSRLLDHGDPRYVS